MTDKPEHARVGLSSVISHLSSHRTYAIVALLGLSAVLHGSAISGWWLADDTQVLVQAVRQSPDEYFFVPKAWRYLSASNFTPLVTLSFETDLAAVGLRPQWFYLHQVVALTAAAILLFVYLIPASGPLAAFLGSALFLASPQAIVAARTLMVRHYVEGLVLSLLALILWRAGRARTVLSVIAAAFYLLALLAKEVYAPLPLIMILESRVAREPIRRVMLRMVPVLGALAGYVIWRLRMLGSVGGYGASVDFSSRFFAGVSTAVMAGAPGILLFITTAALLFVLVLAARRHPTPTVTFLVVAMVVVLTPILPVSGQMEVRHAFVVAVFIAAGVSIGVNLARTPAAWIAFAFALIATVAAGQIVRSRYEEAARQTVAEGKYVWAAPGKGPVLLAKSPGWYLAGLAELRTLQRGDRPPRFVLSRDALVIEPMNLRGVLLARTSILEPLDRDTMQSIEAERRTFNPDIPLSIVLTRDQNLVRWQFGPEPASGWTFLTYPDYDEYSVPARGSRVIPDPSARQFFRIRRLLPDGRWTISPPLPLPEAGRRVVWRR